MTKQHLPDKAESPRMFSSIAGRYDLLNHVLSANIDRSWRRALVHFASVEPGELVMDAATGTADVAIAFAKYSEAGRISGVDLATGMLDVGRTKVVRGNLAGRIDLVEGDVLDLPYEDATFDIVTIAFGLRNLPDYAAGVAEMTRVLKPGGRLLILEFFPPRGGLFLRAYKLYLGRVVPIAGRVISGSKEAYRYLASSVEHFMTHDEMRSMMESRGLSAVESHRLTGGIATIYRGVKR